MKTSELDFDLPADLIAQTPPDRRDAARLLHYRRSSGLTERRTFTDLPSLLRAGDLLVFNDSRVVPAKLLFTKPTGGRVEGLFLHDLGGGRWRVLLKNVGRVGVTLTFADDPGLVARVIAKEESGYTLQLEVDGPAETILGRVGRMPLPPYIKRQREGDPLDDLDRARYQTVYARLDGSIAAPTAGLHFTPELLAELETQGVERTAVTLHVGMGTFKPVSADDLELHEMHTESYEIPAAAAKVIRRARSDRRRVIAVGTTAARVLESQHEGEIVPIRSETNIFIRPPYYWKHVDALITNFHLPRSTLIALVAAFVGIDAQRRLYAEAIAQRYRFFSYGDSSFLE